MCIISLLPELITFNVGSRIFLLSLFVSCVCSIPPDHRHDLLDQPLIHWVYDENVSFERNFSSTLISNSVFV
jgi:hypothetical protein